MKLKDLHELPKIRDSWSFLYVEHGIIDKEDQAIAVHDEFGITPVPCSSICLLMLGPGTRITHAAIMTLVDNGCLISWCGEQGVRFYASGCGETRHSGKLIKQASLCTHKSSRLKVIRRMYAMRFAEVLDDSLTLQQIRGMEGVRVRDAYARWSAETGIPWQGRNYNRSNWQQSDPVNRALSCANSCLYGVCHAAIVALGYSPGLGFIHTGKQLSFVYDVADLYKVEISIPAAFKAAAELPSHIEQKIRYYCRDLFKETKLLSRIADDIERVLDISPDEESELSDFDSDPAMPGALWDPDRPGGVEGGVSYGEENLAGEGEKPCL